MDPDVRVQMKRMLSIGATLGPANYTTVFNTCIVKVTLEEAFHEVWEASGRRAARGGPATIRPGAAVPAINATVVGIGRTTGPSATIVADMSYSAVS